MARPEGSDKAAAGKDEMFKAIERESTLSDRVAVEIEELIVGQKLTKERFIEEDVRFHALLAEATQNHLFVALLNSIADLMGALREVGTTVPGARSDARKYHRQILQRVSARDAEGARSVMSEHMDA